MPIEIRKVGDLYTARVWDPRQPGQAWATPKPMTCRRLVDLLVARGCHQIDVGDAFYEADPDWLASAD